MQEEWRDVVGYEGLYQVSNLGRVKSLKRTTRKSNGVYQTKKESIISDSCNGNGYRKVTLFDVVKRSFNVHTLVAMAFLGVKPVKSITVVDHINNNKSDNRLDNLRIISHRENISRGNRGLTREHNIYKVRNKYRVIISNKGLKYNLGYFDSIEEAIKRRDYFKENEL